MQKHVEQIDRETGEAMQGCMVYIPTDQGLQKGGLWPSKMRLKRSLKIQS